MTDEEKIAEEYFKTTYPAYLGCDKFTEEITDAVIYGLKVRIKWHDLRKTPNDLPPLEGRLMSINVLTDNGIVAYYYYRGRMWYDCNGFHISSPKAWCEIPKFNGGGGNEM